MRVNLLEKISFLRKYNNNNFSLFLRFIKSHRKELNIFSSLRRASGPSGKVKNRNFWGLAILICCAIMGAYFIYALSPAGGAEVPSLQFEVKPGEGFRTIADHLKENNLIRSSLGFQIFSFLTGSAFLLKPGVYEFSPAMSSPAILGALINGENREVEVTIPEGATVYEIDALLSEKNIISPGELLHFYSLNPGIEGKLFPDTYKFFVRSEAKIISQKFLANFKAKAEPLLARDPQNQETNLILASLLEKETPDFKERQLVAGILKKRLNAGIPLQVDASICYVKQIKGERESCLPITVLDLKIDSPYNTYVYKGLPPGPIGNPGISAIKAALEFQDSPYWYYLSDPRTKKTIFAKEFEEHLKNRLLYLNAAGKNL